MTRLTTRDDLKEVLHVLAFEVENGKELVERLLEERDFQIRRAEAYRSIAIRYVEADIWGDRPGIENSLDRAKSEVDAEVLKLLSEKEGK